MAKEQPEKLTGTSLDISAENRTRLKALFPAVFTETRNDKGDLVESIDFEKLKAELGTFSDLFESRRERYGMDWPGKKEALRLIQTPSAATLRPCREESVNFDTTRNLFIEGDNLEVLKLLQNSYYGKVKMIVIDPPYNTGNEFIYPDNFSESLQTYLEYAGLIDGDGKKFSTNTANEGRFHTKWLNMMYPRLYLARNMLKNDGVIFIHIDDNEAHNLRLLMNEVFGEENFVAQFIWSGGRKNDSKLVSVSHEYVICYVKSLDWYNQNNVLWRQRKKGLGDIYSQYAKLKRDHQNDYSAMTRGLKDWFKGLSDSHPAKSHKHYSHVDKKGIYFPDNISWPGGGGPKFDVLNPNTGKPVRVPSRGWMTSDPGKMKQWIENDLVHFGSDENSVPCIKSYLKDREAQVPYSFFYQDGRASTKRLRTILGGDYFDHPKDELILKEFLQFTISVDDIVLDFFAGSCTTAHAVLDLNKEDGGNRKFICVQLPEPCSHDSEAFKAGYKTIADIGKERIRRVIKKIEDERATQDKKNSEALPGMLKEQPSIDLGFKVLKLNKSNFKPWQKLDPSAPVEKIEKQLELHIDHINPEATPEDLLYEILLKAGFPPTEKIETKIIAGINVFSVSDGGLLFCLEKPVTKELIDAVAEAEPMQFICLDSAFHGNDQLKANSVQTFAARNMQREKHNKIIFKTV